MTQNNLEVTRSAITGKSVNKFVVSRVTGISLKETIHAINLSGDNYVIVSEIESPSLPNGKETVVICIKEFEYISQLMNFLNELIDSE